MKIRIFKDSDSNSLQEGQRHIRLVNENIPQCYIATNNAGKPVYRNWLFKHTENNRLVSYFGPIFPKLKPNEAIIEGVFTHPEYRGQRVMPNAIYAIVNQEQHKHLNRIMAFVKDDNEASIKAFRHIGFKPFMIREEKWRFFNRKISLTSISSTERELYNNHNTSASN